MSISDYTPDVTPVSISRERYGELLEAESRVAELEADMEAAAGELMMDLPEPGTDASKLLSANVLMRRQRDEAESRVTELEAEREKIVETIANRMVVSSNEIRLILTGEESD